MEKFTCEDTYRRTAQITYPHPSRESTMYLLSSKCIVLATPIQKEKKEKRKKGVKE